jgi:hypothetical protein
MRVLPFWCLLLALSLLQGCATIDISLSSQRTLRADTVATSSFIAGVALVFTVNQSVYRVPLNKLVN